MKQVTEFTFRFIAFPVMYFFVITWATIWGALAGLLHYVEFTATMAKQTHIQLLQRFGMLPKQKKVIPSLDDRLRERALHKK